MLPRSPWAEPREPVSGFAFDGIGGYVYLGHTGFQGTYRDAWGSSSYESLQDLGGAVRAGLRYSNLEARLGIGGIFLTPHYDSPEGSARRRLTSFRVAIDEAALRLAFPRFGPAAAFEFGVFRFQSNPDAALFGEYLTRYGAYPGSVERGPLQWDSLGSLAGQMEALRLTWGGPRLRSDFLWLFDSSAVDGHADFSYALFLEGTFARGFTWGAGGELFRAQSSEPEGLTSHSSRNGYVKTGSGYVLLDDLPFDTVPRPREDTGYFTRSATMFSLRAAVDFGDLFGTEGEMAGGWPDWRLFAETALLGWGDQPLFFEDRWSRLAWTIGAHAPTGGWLDDLCVQAERHPSHYRLVLRPAINGVNLSGPEEREPEKWKFGALASKTVWGGFAVQFQYLFQPMIDSSNYSRPAISGNPGPGNWAFESTFNLRLHARF